MRLQYASKQLELCEDQRHGAAQVGACVILDSLSRWWMDGAWSDVLQLLEGDTHWDEVRSETVHW